MKLGIPELRIVAAVAVIAAIQLVPARADAEDFSGIWKKKCGDYYGLLIKPAGGKMYSIVFCGLDGCFAPEQYTPNSAIEGDPGYVVQPDGTLGVRWKNGKGIFYYTRCSTAQEWSTAESKKLFHGAHPEGGPKPP